MEHLLKQLDIANAKADRLRATLKEAEASMARLNTCGGSRDLHARRSLRESVSLADATGLIPHTVAEEIYRRLGEKEKPPEGDDMS